MLLLENRTKQKTFKSIDKKKPGKSLKNNYLAVMNQQTDAKMSKKEEKSKFNIRTINNANVLFKDEQPVQCIYKIPTVLPHPQIQGQAVINNPVCSDQCPMFNLTPGLFGKLKFECTKYEIDIYTLTPLT